MVIGEGERRRRRKRRGERERDCPMGSLYNQTTTTTTTTTARVRCLVSNWTKRLSKRYRPGIESMESKAGNYNRNWFGQWDGVENWRGGELAASVCRRGWRVDWGRCMLGFDLNLIPSNLCCDFSSPFKREREYACVAFLFSWRTIKRILAIRWIEYINSSNLIKRLQTWAFNTRVLKFIQKTFYLSNPLIVPRINFERDYYITCIHHLQPHQTQFE